MALSGRRLLSYLRSLEQLHREARIRRHGIEDTTEAIFARDAQHILNLLLLTLLVVKRHSAKLTNQIRRLGRARRRNAIPRRERELDGVLADAAGPTKDDEPVLSLFGIRVEAGQRHVVEEAQTRGQGADAERGGLLQRGVLGFGDRDLGVEQEVLGRGAEAGRAQARAAADGVADGEFGGGGAAGFDDDAGAVAAEAEGEGVGEQEAGVVHEGVAGGWVSGVGGLWCLVLDDVGLVVRRIEL